MEKTWTTNALADEAERQGRSVTAEYIRQLCVAGEIKASKPGRDWMISDAEAIRWLRDWLSTRD